VIALGKGGAVETVGRGLDSAALACLAAGGVERAPGGVLFGDESVEGLMAAIIRFEAEFFDAEALHDFVLPFDTPRFDREFRAAFAAGLAAAQSGTV
jgi:hypothetical protein